MTGDSPLSSSYRPIPNQSDRWTSLRTLASSLLKDSAPDEYRWVHLPDIRARAGPHPTLQLPNHDESNDTMDHATDDDDGSLESYMKSKQSLPTHFHTHPILLTPAARSMWRKLASWDRRQQIQSMQREQALQADSNEAKPSSIDNENESPSLPAIGWASRGLFLDGPNGISKSTSLYALTCLARATGWCVVHINDADAWVGELGVQGASRIWVQAIYEAAATTVLPSTATWSQPHSLLQLPLSPELDYTPTLIDQGIRTFGELLELSLELSDGLEETELAIECIMAQLFALQDIVPVLIVVDGFDAITQKCLQPQTQNAEKDTTSSGEEELIAPITTSPFCWANYHRMPAFRGCFVVSGESFALVQQSHPELMERIQSANDDDANDESARLQRDAAADVQHAQALRQTQARQLQNQEIEPIHVWPLSLLHSSAICKEYIIRRLQQQQQLSSDSSSSSTPSSFLLSPSLPASYWSFLFHRLTSGHFGLMNALLSHPLVRSCSTFVPETKLHAAVVDLILSNNHDAYTTHFGSSPTLRSHLASFFAQQLPQGFYSTHLARSRSTDAELLAAQLLNLPAQAILARDYNLVPINADETRGMIEWVNCHVNEDKQQTEKSSSSRLAAILLDTAAWARLHADVAWEQLSKPALRLVQQYKLESFLQLFSTALLLNNAKPSSLGSISLTPVDVEPQDASATSTSLTFQFPISSVCHWSASTDPPILHWSELIPTGGTSSCLRADWSMNSAIEGLHGELGVQPIQHLTSLLHINAVSGQEISTSTATMTDTSGAPPTFTFFFPILDPSLYSLLFTSRHRPTSSTPLMHTLYLHLLTEWMRQVELSVGPMFRVEAVNQDGRSATS